MGLQMKLEGGPQETWFFDKQSGRLLREEPRTANFEGEDTVSVTTYEDYQTLDGFPLARKETVQRDGKPAWTQELIKFQVATPSPAAFAKPDQRWNRCFLHSLIHHKGQPTRASSKIGEENPPPLTLQAEAAEVTKRSVTKNV
jgi:hypothetical protein